MMLRVVGLTVFIYLASGTLTPPLAQDDNYYRLPDEPWADKEGRIRYGPLGVPAPEYHRLKRERERREAERKSEERRKAFQEWSKNNKPQYEESKGIRGTPKMPGAEPHYNWKYMAWPWGRPPKAWGKGLVDW